MFLGFCFDCLFVVCNIVCGFHVGCALSASLAERSDLGPP